MSGKNFGDKLFDSMDKALNDGFDKVDNAVNSAFDKIDDAISSKPEKEDTNITVTTNSDGSTTVHIPKK